MDALNCYLFTGENTYMLRRELQRWRKGFFSKHGAENYCVLCAKDCTVSDLLDAVSVMPFIAEKRLVVLEGIPKIEKEDMETVFAGMHPQTVLLIVESKPDKRLGVVKHIEKTVEMKSFPLLSHAELCAWIKASVASEGCGITPDAMHALLDIVGDDQWTLETELQKLAAGSHGDIDRAAVESLCMPSGSQVIWKLTDLIGSKKPIEALAFCVASMERGEDPYALWTILLSMIKNLTLVFASADAGVRDERTIASATGLHFLAVRGLLPLARSMDILQIKALVDWSADADIQLKSGGYHYSSDRPDEVIALTERAILMTRLIPNPSPAAAGEKGALFLSS